MTVNGPGNYNNHDFQPVMVGVDEVKEYSFSCVVPDVAGTYVMEVGLTPARLTAYDTAWLKVN